MYLLMTVTMPPKNCINDGCANSSLDLGKFDWRVWLSKLVIACEECFILELMTEEGNRNNNLLIEELLTRYANFKVV